MDFFANLTQYVESNNFNRNEIMPIFTKFTEDNDYFFMLQCQVCLQNIASSSPFSITFRFCTTCTWTVCYDCKGTLEKQLNRSKCEACDKMKLFDIQVPNRYFESNLMVDNINNFTKTTQDSLAMMLNINQDYWDKDPGSEYFESDSNDSFFSDSYESGEEDDENEEDERTKADEMELN